MMFLTCFSSLPSAFPTRVFVVASVTNSTTTCPLSASSSSLFHGSNISFNVHIFPVDIMFILVFCRFIGRLYLFPIKVLEPAAYWGLYKSPLGIDMPFYIFFNCLLWIVLILNFYWFMVCKNFSKFNFFSLIFVCMTFYFLTVYSEFLVPSGFWTDEGP